jgi:hypothetical protein
VGVHSGGSWLPAGITGLARRREWDAVATADAPGTPEAEAQFVLLPDGRVLIEDAPPGFDPEPLVAALETSIEGPYRAVAVRRPELWVVGATSISVTELGRDPRGDSVEVVRDEGGVSTRVDGLPTLDQLPELEQIGGARAETYVVRARRLVDLLFEVEVEPL